MDLDSLSLTARLALTGQVLLLLGGLVVLSRLFLTPKGRAAWRAEHPLSPLPWTLFEFGIAIFTVIAGAVAGQIAASLVTGGLPLDEEHKITILGAGFQLGMLGGALMARLAITKTRLPVAIDEPAPDDPPALAPQIPSAPHNAPWFAGPVTLLVALPVLTAANLGWIGLLEHFGLNTEKQAMVDVFATSQSPFVLFGMSFLAVIVAPVTEEVIFRAGLFRYLRTRIPRPLAVVLPALLFGVLHGSLAAFVPLVLLGIIFALAYERTGRISVPIVAHALFNLNTILMLLSGVEF